MTVSYNVDVIRTTSFVGFLRLQFRWRGSIWKHVINELLLFSIAFAVIAVVYRTNYFLTDDQRQFWNNFATLFDQKMDYIPLTFMLGFFVTIIVGRWNDIINNIGWIDNPALYLATYVRGADEKSRILRRNIVRYLVLTQTLIFRDISIQVRKRFPTLETLIAAGILNEKEMDEYEKVRYKHNKYWLPTQWSLSLLYDARMSGKIASDVMLNNIIEQIRQFRTGLGRLCNYDWVPVPLVYPQVVFLAVRSYFVLCLIARQSVRIRGASQDGQQNSQAYPVVPFLMTALQFIFYVGWMKVAESLMNPLGEDDDDFECNYLIDRNLAVGLMMVDGAYNSMPVQEKDKFWADEVEPLYSAESAMKPIFPMQGSVANIELPPKVDEVLMMAHVENRGGREGWIDADELDEKAQLVPVSRCVSFAASEKNASRQSVFSRADRPNFLRRLSRHFSRQPSLNPPRFRPSKLSVRNRTFSSNSANYEPDELGMTPTVELASPSITIDILSELAKESMHADKDGQLNSKSPTRMPQSTIRIGGTLQDQLMSVPEEEESETSTQRSSHSSYGEARKL